MPKPELPKAVLFDFNGTLHDMKVVRNQDIVVGREVFGLELTDADVRACWGRQAPEFYPMLFGREGSRYPNMSWQDMRKAFQRYDSDPRFRRRALPGVISTMSHLHRAGITMGIVTSGQPEKVHAYIKEAKLPRKLLSFVHTNAEIGDDMRHNRPILTKAIGELAARGIQPSQAIFVGDEAVTIKDAEPVGGFVVVASGTTYKDELLRQGVPRSKLIDDMGQLPRHIGL